MNYSHLFVLYLPREFKIVYLCLFLINDNKFVNIVHGKRTVILIKNESDKKKKKNQYCNKL